MKHRAAFVVIALLLLAAPLRTLLATKVVAATHGAPLSGTVASVEPRSRTFVLATGSANVAVQWTEATRVTGGTLRAGARVLIRTISKAGRTYATTIQVQNAH